MNEAIRPSLSVVSLNMDITNMAIRKVGRKSRGGGMYADMFTNTAITMPMIPAFML